MNSRRYIIDVTPKLSTWLELINCNLDKDVGHYRRYEKSFFENLNLSNGQIVELKYMDCMGYILYYMK